MKFFINKFKLEHFGGLLGTIVVQTLFFGLFWLLTFSFAIAGGIHGKHGIKDFAAWAMLGGLTFGMGAIGNYAMQQVRKENRSFTGVKYDWATLPLVYKADRKVWAYSFEGDSN
jgi:hypothetical protein